MQKCRENQVTSWRFFGSVGLIIYICNVMKITHGITRSELKYFQKLLQKKYRQTEKKFIVEGTRLVEEVLNSDWNVETFFFNQDFLEKNSSTNLLRRAKKQGIPTKEISGRDLRNLSDTV